MQKIETVAVCGPDGSGKDTSLNLAYLFFLNKCPEARILEIGKPTRFWDGSSWRAVETGITRGLDNFHQWADKTRNRGLITAASALSVQFMWRYQEPHWKKRLNPNFVISIRDPQVDPAAYAVFYTPETIGKMPIPQRVRFFRQLNGADYRENIVFLNLDPKIAVERINRRVKEEIQNGGDGKRPPKWVHLHENEPGISTIRDEFIEVLNYMKGYCGTRVTIIESVQERNIVANQLAEILIKRESASKR